MVSEGIDYVFFRSAYHSGGAIAGMRNAEVALIATRRYVFLVPIHETWLGLGWMAQHSAGDAIGVAEALARYLATPSLTLDALEAEMCARLHRDHVVELDALASLTVWSRFLRQVRYRRERSTTQVLALRGKANHERFRRWLEGQA